jgi:hypothetical protein
MRISKLLTLSLTALSLSTLTACEAGSPGETEAETGAEAQVQAETPDDAFDLDHEFMTEQAVAFAGGEAREALVDFGAGPQTVPVLVRNGWVYFQGDMLLGRVDEVRFADALPGKGDHADHPGLEKAALSHRNPWPNGEVVFQIDTLAFPLGSPMRATILQAIASVNATSMLKVREKGALDFAYLRITRPADGVGCNSFVGYAPPPVTMEMHLAQDCSVGSIIHEFGHAGGLFHEQARADRDTQIRVLTNNIIDAMEPQFQTYIVNGLAGLDFGSFDFGSIMLYPSFNGFANDVARPTMNKRSCAANDFSAACTWSVQRDAYSGKDAAALSRQVTGDPLAKFKIRNVAHNQCLRPAGASIAEGATISVVVCDSNSKAQRWYTWRRPGMARDVIVNENSRHCLARNAAGTLIQTRCTSTDAARQFQFVGLGLFRGEQLQQSGGRCVFATSTDATVSNSCADTTSREFTRDYL